MSLVEEGDTVEVNLQDVSISFDPAGDYAYTSTLDYTERGTFRTDGEYLITQPNVPDTIPERAVEIATLEPSVLRLNMQEGDKRRVLMFERVGTNPSAPAQ